MNQKPHEQNHQDVDDARLTAYALGQLDAADAAEVDAWLSQVGESRAAEVRRTIDQVRALSAELVEASRHDDCPPPSPQLRTILEQRLAELESTTSSLPQAGEGPGVRTPDLLAASAIPKAATIQAKSDEESPPTVSPKPRSSRRRWLALAAAACLLAVVVPAVLWTTLFGPRAGVGPVAFERSELKSQAFATPSEPPAAATPESFEPLTESPANAPALPMGQPEGEVLDFSSARGYHDTYQGGSPEVPSKAFSSRRVADDAAGRGLPAEESEVAGQAQSANSRLATMGDAAADKDSPAKRPAALAASAPAASGPEPAAGQQRYDYFQRELQGQPAATYGSRMAGKAAMPSPAKSDGGLKGAAPMDDRAGGSGPAATPHQLVESLGVRVDSGGVRAVPDSSVLPSMAGGMGGQGSRKESATAEAPAGQPNAQGPGRLSKRSPPEADYSLSEMNRRASSPTPPAKPAAGALATSEQRGQQLAQDRMSVLPGSSGDQGLSLYGREDLGRFGRGLDRGAPGSEQYEPIAENPFLSPAAAPLSTFSIDVDTASYANVRRFLVSGRLPPPAAVRIEEMVNYFPYDYPEPDGEHPFSVNMEVAQCPWNGNHRLVRIGLKGREIHRNERGPSNLVFLLDVSGSMRDRNKLPLVKEGMKMLVDQLGEDDRVAIVTYAGNAGLALESTNAENKQKILQAIDALRAGGSTHGSAGIQMAYQQASEHFVDGGTNRVLLATDGDLNVGVTDDDQLVELIRQKAKTGVFLTVLGFGTGNLKDAKLEKLADNGNGSYAYIDSLREAYKVLVEQATGSLVTIAKDVKIQVEFNPAEVRSYRLIGYENRILAAEDFADDTKDAGEIGAGHTVTALYEVVPASGASGGALAADREGGAVESADTTLKYQRPATPELTEEATSGELLTLHLRYKQPEAETSQETEYTLKDAGKRFGEASDDFRFAAAVASFGMVLRGSQYAAGLQLPAVEEFAAGALGRDPEGYRREFTDLVRQTEADFAQGEVAGSAAQAGAAVISAEPAQPAPASRAVPAEKP